MIPASSVPFFSEERGESFRDVAEFETALSTFLSRLEHFKPRKYVVENRSMKESAEIYGNLYLGITCSGDKIYTENRMQALAAAASILALSAEASRGFGDSFSSADASKMTQERSRFVGSEGRRLMLEGHKNATPLRHT